jgi:uncharacterized membrane protein YphA (DoxX/SURF4 family)
MSKELHRKIILASIIPWEPSKSGPSSNSKGCGNRGAWEYRKPCRFDIVSEIGTRNRPNDRREMMNVLLWIVQALLAALFLFTGGMKLVLPLEQMKGPVELPGLFLRFIGIAEVAGGLGLILPGIFRIKTELTPLAALGLLVIMVGATAITLKGGMVGPALFPLATGILLAFIAYWRWRRLPHPSRSVPQVNAR